MFKLHDKTRRLLTLLIFLLLGPMLLGVVVVKVCSRHSVRTVAEWETLLGNSLGKRVEIESLAFPAPGVVRFSQFQVIDPETDTVLLQIPQWELVEMVGEMPQQVSPVATSTSESPSGDFYESYFSRTSYRRGLFASIGFSFACTFGDKERYWQCEIPSVSCYASAIPHAKDTLVDLMAKRPGSGTHAASLAIGTKPVVVHIGEIDIFSQLEDRNHPEAKQKYDCVTLKNLNLEFRPTEENTLLCAMWQLSGESSNAEPFRLSVSRQRSLPTTTNLQFCTGSTEIPTSLLARLDPFFEGFGPQCRFKGTLVADDRRNDDSDKRSRSFELKQAALSNVAIDSFLQDSIPFRMDGTIDQIAFDSLVFRSESVRNAPFVLEYAKGILFNGRGVVYWPGLRQLVEGTKLRIVPETANPPETDVSFRNVTFAFIFDAQGIRLFPEEVARSQVKPLLLIDNHCEIYWPRTDHMVRYNELLTALSRPNSSQIPLMLETRHLISTLPITAEPAPESPMIAHRNDIGQQRAEPIEGYASRPIEQVRINDIPVDHQAQSQFLQPNPQQIPQAFHQGETPVMGTVPQLGEITPPMPIDNRYDIRHIDNQNQPYLASNQMPPLHQPNPSPVITPPETYYPPMPRPQEQNPEASQHLFLGGPQSTQPTIPQQPITQQPAPYMVPQGTQGMTPNVSNGQFAGQPNPLPPYAQPVAVPYGANQTTGQYTSQRPVATSRRAIIPAMSFSANRVQTSDVPDIGPSSDTPFFDNPFETQVALAPQPQQNGYALPPLTERSQEEK